ncbi:gamma-glutamylcyclotransferase family protein [uncultured Litoreibacter sp.]|uniref:gamma-glutamylcyclotransferase family protein n=1 Tax=uncultured Litoreibacter sp. TaxID=1392394 RepID=UPI002638B3AC|nr:gamma-glutamylcyclotransferase family protein [uncultured Litoreibacter sp.]
MNNPYFFGYGSLVNAKTHVYSSTHPAKLSGWRRVWRHNSGAPQAFLSVTPDADSNIDGLIAEVPNADWKALDLRESGYFRNALPATSLVHGAGGVDVHMYQVHLGNDAPPSTDQPILLSYLDVVVQGYLEVFGEVGAARFFDTTDGWDTPILNDRSAPIYPRSQTLSAAQSTFVDDHLSSLGAQLFSR